MYTTGLLSPIFGINKYAVKNISILKIIPLNGKAMPLPKSGSVT
jgi:hypothetical protein